MPDIIFFPSPAEFRKWLDKNHASEKEVYVGFYKKDSGKVNLTWPQSVDEALCYGWIDGVRKSIDEESYTIRFTPRKQKSIWSAVNIKRVPELAQLGLMLPAGLKIFEERDPAKADRYAFEQKKEIKFDENYEKTFRENEKAWNFFKAQAPSYQKTLTWWVISPKQETTRLKRLTILIKSSEHGVKVT